MDASTSLTALDAELRRLRQDADFAEARFGRTHAAGLRHVHDELAAVLLVAFERAAASNNLALSRRDRVGLARHGEAIAVAVREDLTQIDLRYAKAIAHATPQGPGARALLESALTAGRVKLDQWWEGRLRLGPLTSPTVAARDWHEFRPLPRWVPWTLGGAATASAAVPLSALLFF